MSSTDVVYCPLCSAKERKPVVLLGLADADRAVVTSDGKMIVTVVECSTCRTRVKTTQHAVRDEEGGFSIL